MTKIGIAGEIICRFMVDFLYAWYGDATGYTVRD